MTDKQRLRGLSPQEVEASRQLHGTNLLTPPVKTSLWRLFAEKFNDPIIRILLIAALLSLGISFIHQEFSETIGIFVAILGATGIGFWFERDASKKFDLLNQVSDDQPVKVSREGVVQEIPRSQIVVGDIVHLQAGDEVPADGELLESVSLQIDESCLTGELLVNKTTHPEHFDSEATYPSNHVLRGTKVMDGHAIYCVACVGDATEYGKVAQTAGEENEEVTPLNKQLDGLAQLVGFAGFLLALLTFLTLLIKDLFGGNAHHTLGQLGLLGAALLGLFVSLTKVWFPLLWDGLKLMSPQKATPPRCVSSGSWLRWILSGIILFLLIALLGWKLFDVDPRLATSWITLDTATRLLNYFMVSVTLIVVAVPEGLPMSVTLSLALSMRRMLQSNNLVRKMHACETMGATTVICTDKTGTLTQNRMQVHEVAFPSLPNQDYDMSTMADLIMQGIAVNTTAFLSCDEAGAMHPIGNPTESALLLWMHQQGCDYASLREDTPVLEQLPFSTERKYMATLVQSPTSGKQLLFIKGAPEMLLTHATTLLTQEGVEPLVPLERHLVSIEAQLLAYQKQAMRTLAFAYKEIDATLSIDLAKEATTNITFLGIAAIADPIRPDVPSAVQECMEAGVAVKIVTGDTPATAREIGRQIGIWKRDDTEDQIITGTQFAALSDAEAYRRVQQLKIMCRARPADKQRLVKLLQQHYEIVAVTGDGTNDAPALNHANVGLSMGSGTSVAKEASDITLLDDSFASIATAIMWGRSLYQNIQRFILFQLTINLTALAIVLVGSIVGHELPLTVTQMLWVNLIMDTFAAGALASLPPNRAVMKEKPRQNSAFIITRLMGQNILYVALVFFGFLMGLLAGFGDAPTPRHMTLFFTIFVFLQFWNMFNAKAFGTVRSAFHGLRKTPAFLVVGLCILVGQFLIVTLGGDVFRTVPLSLKDWLIAFGTTSIVLWVGEIIRAIRRARSKNN